MANEEKDNEYRQYFEIAGITIQLESELPITHTTLDPRFGPFQVDGPGEDMVTIRFRFPLPDIYTWDLGEEIYRRKPWAIYKTKDSFIYVGIFPDPEDRRFDRVGVINHSYTDIQVYLEEEIFRNAWFRGISFLRSDQIFLARMLADREGFYLHSSGMILDGRGYVFVGHSGIGKSTIATMLKNKAEILCEDRNIIRKGENGFNVYGTWDHGGNLSVSPNSAPLNAIFFLEQAEGNRLIPLDDKREVTRRLLACLIKPLATPDWWEKILPIVEDVMYEVPFYILEFDKSGKVVDLLEKL